MIDVKILEKIKPGAKIRVFEKIKEGDKERVASFEGLVIARKHGSESGATFIVRRVVAGVGVERIFPIYSPRITQIKIIDSPKKVHRSKLYFVRKLSSKKLREKLG